METLDLLVISTKIQQYCYGMPYVIPHTMHSPISTHHIFAQHVFHCSSCDNGSPQSIGLYSWISAMMSRGARQAGQHCSAYLLGHCQFHMPMQQQHIASVYSAAILSIRWLSHLKVCLPRPLSKQLLSCNKFSLIRDHSCLPHNALLSPIVIVQSVRDSYIL